MKMTQKAAVFAAITSVLAEAGIAFEEGMDVAPHMTREVRAQVNAILFEGFKAENIELEKVFSDSDLKGYVSGLQSNWIRKDTRLNGGTKYVAKNPGSRVGQGDAQLKALKALLSTKSDPTEVAEIQSYITARESEIKATKSVASVNFDALPAALRTKYETA
jgi:hypothetical protein